MAGSVAVPVATALERQVEGYLDHLAVERGLARNTLAAYRRDLDRYGTFLAESGRTSVADVDESDVRGFVTSIRTGQTGSAPLAASSTARVLAAVHGWHRFATVEGWAPTDPSHGVKPPAQPRRLRQGWCGGRRGQEQQCLLLLLLLLLLPCACPALSPAEPVLRPPGTAPPAGAAP